MILQTWSHWLRDKCSTYSSTRLTRGARVSWEADRTLQTHRGIEKSELASHIWHCVNNSCGRRKLDWEIWHNDAVAGSSNSASVMDACVFVQLTYRVTLGTIISRGSTCTGGSSSSWGPSFSLLTRLSFRALRKYKSMSCHHEDHIRAIHTTLTIGY